MYNFNKTYNLIIEDIIQSVTPEELKERQKEYHKIQIKALFDKLFEENKMIKNPDGSYDVNGDIHIYDMNLNSLLYLPYKLNKINGAFSCNYNNLTNLEGCPKIVNGYFSCAHNNLTNLKESPTIINNWFDCHSNDLTSLEGCPKKVKGDFWAMNNQVKFKEEDIRKICKVGGTIYV